MTVSHLKAVLFGVGSFCLPILVLLIAAWADGIYPLGGASFIEADLRYQYVDFFAWYRDVLLGNADPFYSTAQGLGNSTAAMFGYYLASPFNLILPAFDEKDIPLFCFIVVLLKIGCIQLSTAFYLCKRFSLGYLWSCMLALGFSLSVWTLTQLRNPMWLDGLIMLPLCAWSVCLLLRDGRWRPLALAYGICVLTNWYMGYMIGLFLCLYVIFEGYVLGFEGVQSWGKLHRKRLLLFCGAMALGLAISAIVFLPSVLGILSNGTSVDGEEQILSIVEKRAPSLSSIPLPFFLATAVLGIAILAGIIFLVFRKRSLRRRAAICLFVMLLCCLALCIAVPAMQHGTFTDVMGGLAYGAWKDSYTPQLFGNFVVLFAACALFVLRSVPLKLKLATGLFLFLLLLSSWLFPLAYVWGGFRLPAGYHTRVGFLFVFMLLWCAAYTFRVLTTDGSMQKVRRALSLCPVKITTLLAVSVGTAIRAALIWGTIFGFITFSSFANYSDAAELQIEELEDRDPGIYRVEKAYWKLGEESLNEGMSLGVNQLASYTSTGDGSIMAFLTALGCGDGKFFTYESSPSLAMDSLMGVKYLSSQDLPPGYLDVGFSLIETPEGARFYENPYALSLAYGVPESIVDFQMPEGDRWECLNAFAKAVWGHDANLYPQAGSSDRPALDMTAFTQLIDQLKAHQFTFNEFGGSHITGNMNATEGQMLLMTIPNQAGWSVTVNGETVEPQDVAEGALMAIPVQPGENHVEMQFTPPGLIPGAIITLLALLAIILIPRLRKSQREQMRAAQEEALPAVVSAA